MGFNSAFKGLIYDLELRLLTYFLPIHIPTIHPPLPTTHLPTTIYLPTFLAA